MAKERSGNAPGSRYDTKVKRRQQMYGPGCCAHSRRVPHPPRLQGHDGTRLYWWQDEAHVRALGLR